MGNTTLDLAAASEPTETSSLLGDHEVHPTGGSGDVEGVAYDAHGNVSTESNSGDDSHHDNAVTDRNGIPATAAKMHLFLPAVGIGLYLAAVDQVLTTASYARIGSELNALNNISWVATSYFLTLTSFQPLYGKLCDIFGRKECLLFAYAFFAVGCLGCGLARNLVQLCVSRAISGIGGGGMTSIVAILVSDIVPLRDRGVWQGYMSLIFAAGMATGGPLGGLFADTIGWRWSFLAQTPLCCIAWIAVYFVVKVPGPPSDSLLNKVRRIDFLGALVLTLAIVAMLLGLDSGSNSGWLQIATVVPLCLAPALIAAFMFIEARIAKHPFAPYRIIFHSSLFKNYAANFCNTASQMSIFFFAPLYFQAVLDYNATSSGVFLVPGMATSVIATMVTGWIIKRTGRFYALNIVSHTTLVLGVILLAISLCIKSVLGEVTSIVLTMTGGACGTLFPPIPSHGNVDSQSWGHCRSATLLVALLANAAVEDTAVVVACSYLFRSLGASIGIGVSSALLQQTLRSQLATHLTDGNQASQIERRVRENLDYIKDLPLDVGIMVRESYQVATLVAITPAMIFALAALLTSIWVKEVKLNK
ncbi:hypothetical protein QQS21_009996 [Conoideocrella luteorostrata]|uniref:Major facilitator superfamily (MFS) profile domain-containing protein n=1 Tax=Conoideocrella luteorostrata TaxID=1105319 RepID=A0AAJ0CG08_9HYPO|nr:hypothetical protein QQS21_009996 [Conoideocrella luteorostrata]